MIIAELTDGLGNQMFQYAAARSLASRRVAVLKLDLDHFTHHEQRRYGLAAFNIRAEKAAWLDVARLCPQEALDRVIRQFRPRRLRGALRRFAARCGLESPCRPRTSDYSPGAPLPPLRVGNVASERFYHYDPSLATCPDDTCLAGYWQNERYFSEIADTLREEFSVKAPLSGKNLEMAQRIQQSMSVSLHIRRGDKATDSRHRATTEEYCQRAMDYFRTRFADPMFFVFTDDWPWVEAHLNADANIVPVKHNFPNAEHEDLRLMSLCKHHIVAASTFSWWGAWLNAQPDKVVVHPGWRNWVQIPNHDTSEIFPSDWVPIDLVLQA